MDQQNVSTPMPSTRPSAADSAASTGPELAPGLLALARRLQAALVPLEPRPGFLTQLAQQLAATHPQAQATARQREHWLMWAAGIGGALYLAGLGFVSLRAAKAARGRLASVVAGRGAQAAGAPSST